MLQESKVWRTLARARKAILNAEEELHDYNDDITFLYNARSFLDDAWGEIETALGHLEEIISAKEKEPRK